VSVQTELFTLRPEREDDLDFLRLLYASTRAEELAPVPWSPEQKEAFCAQQFAAQRVWYRDRYPGATFEVIEVEGRPVGRLYLERRAEEIRLMDVSLVPEARGRGIGSALLGGLIGAARSAGLPLTVHVERENRALALYLRLGFRVRDDRGVYLFLDWRPENAAEKTPCSSG
jgi:GNAT superfamily N-acetyltransferase